MKSYLDIILQAIILFPFIAMIVSAPFILIQYHHFGSVSIIKAIILYTFVLYIMCAYFLVVLPLPNRDEVAKLTSPRVQLIPFRFIYDFFKDTPFRFSKLSTLKQAVLHSSFYVPAYNFLLTLPFGVYLKYYYKANAKKVLICTFLLSLFFELTQLTGLYFIYPRGYRLFDVDDLMINTMGGFLGYLVFGGVVKHLPQREKINARALMHAREISGFRRSTSFVTDIAIWFLVDLLIYPFNRGIYLSTWRVTQLLIVVHYFVVPCILRGSTLGQWIVRLQVVDQNGKPNPLRLMLRRGIFALLYIGIPLALLYVLENIYKLNVSDFSKLILFVAVCGIVFLLYAISGICYLFTRRPMLYERLSRTKMQSTIAKPEKFPAESEQ